MDPAVSNDPWPRKSIGNVQLCLPPGPMAAESPEEARQADRKAGGPITMRSGMVKQPPPRLLQTTDPTGRRSTRASAATCPAGHKAGDIITAILTRESDAPQRDSALHVRAPFPLRPDSARAPP